MNEEPEKCEDLKCTLTHTHTVIKNPQHPRRRAVSARAPAELSHCDVFLFINGSNHREEKKRSAEEERERLRGRQANDEVKRNQ